MTAFALGKATGFPFMVILIFHPLFLACSLQASEHTRFAPDRMIRTEVCTQHQSTEATCFVVRQFDHSGDFAPPLHLSGTGFKVIGIAANDMGEVILGGVFQGQITSGNHTVRAMGGRDVFFLAIDASGKMARAGRFGSTGDDDAYAVVSDGWGDFRIEGAASVSSADAASAVWTLKVDRDVKDQESVTTDLTSLPDLVIDEGEEDLIEDPIG